MKNLNMKKVMLIAALFVGALVFVNCGGKKATTTSNALGTELNLPCSDEEFHSDMTYFRGTGMAEGTNLASTRRRANLDANAALAASVNRTIKSVTDRYTQDITVGESNEYAERFEDLTRSVVNQSLNNVATVCSKTFEKEGSYNVYVAVEVPKDELLNNISSRISRDDRLRLDYDRMKFEQIFNEEMEKLSNERP
ncbi:MAG: hypothetical protein ACOCX0_05850 [Bacteroidota bacterium]